jgi:hypothetical protein
MTYTFKLSRRLARLRVPLVVGLVLTLFGCNPTDSLDPDTSTPGAPAGQSTQVEAPSLASVSFPGGIPFGLSKQPATAYGSVFDGAKNTFDPASIVSTLAAIKSRGGKVAIMLAGPEWYYKDADGHFSFTKWKARIDRFNNVNFSSYVTDGTVIGHFLIDEPQDPTNWNGVPVPQSTLEAMAQYSKQRWPNMVTIVRTWPDYLDNWSGTYHYLDAAWAQYAANRFPDPYAFISNNVTKAKARGLALVVGLNLIDGSPTRGNMSADQIQNYGTALLSSTYPCSFISWQYRDSYLTSSRMDALKVLRQKAQNRSFKTCWASASAPAPEPAPDTTSTPTPTPTPSPTVTGALPFGVSLMPADQWSTRWTGSVYRADPSDLVQQLNRAATDKMNLIVSLVTKAQSRNADGTFNLTKWKAQVDAYRNLSLGQYITSKTFYLHYLVDQPNCAACWGGTAIPWATVEAMAQYSKSIWPSLPTTVRVAPSKLAGASFHWAYLDAGWAQYNTSQGDLRTYLAAEKTQAQAEGLGLVAGVNLLGAAGYNTAPMTAAQIMGFGTILAKDPSVCALVGWRYDSAYLSQSGIGAALDSVARVAKSRTAASCVAS